MRMARKVISTIRPTRIELLKLRKREILAQKGHDLLEEKRDAMILEFMRIAEQCNEQRGDMEKKTAEAYGKLRKAQMLSGWEGVQGAAYAVPPCREVGTGVRQIMGIAVPVIVAPPCRGERGYSYGNTTVALDEAADSFGRVVDAVLSVAELESALTRVASEIARTKRRINALETVLIPRLRATQKRIETHLEELEREDLFRRKRTKALHKKAEERAVNPPMGGEW
jgi:V/A-type H+-transporting ATPase subunit D